MVIEPTPRCAACGKTLTTAVQSRVHDPWFETPGTFQYLGCSQPECGTLVQHPPPASDLLDAAYAHYFTHAEAPLGPLGRVRRLFRGSRRLRALHLPAVPDGLVLDIGCGDGSDMSQLRDIGWDVVGIDNDPVARRVAADRGLEVYADLDELPAELRPTVVLLRHVVEHVANPVVFLQRLRRHVAASSRVVLVTPNALSFGRRAFGRWWRGYDAPRHLQIFTPNGLVLVAQRAGYEVWSVRTGASSIGGLESESLILFGTRAGLPWTAAYLAGRVNGFLLGLAFLILNRLDRGRRGEEIFLHMSPARGSVRSTV